jgi:hypothetical protein
MHPAGLADPYLVHPLQWPMVIGHRKELTQYNVGRCEEA